MVSRRTETLRRVPLVILATCFAALTGFTFLLSNWSMDSGAPATPPFWIIPAIGSLFGFIAARNGGRLARVGCLILGLLTVGVSTVLLVWMAPDWPSAAGDDLVLLLGLAVADLGGLASVVIAALPDHRLDQWLGGRSTAIDHPEQSPPPAASPQN